MNDIIHKSSKLCQLAVCLWQERLMIVAAWLEKTLSAESSELGSVDWKSDTSDYFSISHALVVT